MSPQPVRPRSSALVASMVLAGVLLLMAGVVTAQQQLPGHQLTSDRAHDLRPIWSPDGARIVFFSGRAGNYDIWVMDADGNNQRQLTTDEGDDRRPAWSPDGRQIVFDSDRGGARNLWVMDADGGNQRQLTTGTAEDSFPAWSPDGRQIAYFSFDGETLNLWVVGADGADPHAVTASLARADRNECTFACHMPEWSPDSQQLAFTSLGQARIWVVDVAGGEPRALSPGREREHFPYWLADGRIIYLSEHNNQDQEPINDVWIMDADGQNAAMIYDAIPHGGPLTFQPDGRTITFHSPRSGNFDIYSIILGATESTPQPMQVTLIPDTGLSGPMAEAPTPTAGAPTAGGEGSAAVTPTTAAEAANPFLPLAAGGALGVVIIAGLTGLYFFINRGRAK